MLFNSFAYILLFLPGTLVSYFLLARYGNRSLAKIALIAASLLFYGWWKYEYLLLIGLSILCNYGSCSLIVYYPSTRRRVRQAVFACGLMWNVGLLAFFKYCDFFLFNVNYLTGAGYSYLNLALPLGISFFTIQQITCLIDVYQQAASMPKLRDYTLFVTFFPQLIAGPIVRHDETVPQFEREETYGVDFRNLSLGLVCFFIGLCKKVVIGDTFGIIASAGFEDPAALTQVDAWATSLAYTFQLYFDFSGYSDMAYGAALMFNIRLPINFSTPYRSTNLVEFWKKWHITLSRFITAYLYTPLVRLADSPSFLVAVAATLLSMLIAGIWHGAGWNFIVFGGLHGVGLICNHLWKKKRIGLSPLLGWFLTFNYVNLTFIFFRAETTGDAVHILKRMFSVPDSFHFTLMANLALSDMLIQFFVMTLAVPLAFYGKNSNQFIASFEPKISNVVFTAALIAVSLFYMNSITPQEFLYFDF